VLGVIQKDKAHYTCDTFFTVLGPDYKSAAAHATVAQCDTGRRTAM